jgi:hypothetical protein
VLKKDNKPVPENINGQIVEKIKEYNDLKKLYIEIQNDLLYERWILNDKKGRTEKLQTNQVAFITFKSMAGKDKAMDLFEFAEDMAKEDPKEEEKAFFNRFLHITSPVAMSSIKWQNMKYSKCNRYTRQIIVWIIALLIIALAFYGMVRFKNYGDGLVAAAPSARCPKAKIPIDEALTDFEKVINQRNNKLHCFCKNYNDANGGVEGTYELFLALDSSLEESPCEAWKFAYDYNFYLVIISGAMISVINAICVVIFEIIVVFEKYQTFMEETIAQFRRIFMI